MNLSQMINEADRLVKQAAERYSQGDTDDCILVLLTLREHMDEPIEAAEALEDNTSENCKLCGKPKTE